MATLNIFLAASRLFKCSKSFFYLSVGILNQVECVKCNKQSYLASFYISIYWSLLLKVKAVFISLFTRNCFYWVLECLATAYTLLALDLAVRPIMRSGVEMRSLVVARRVPPAEAGLSTPSTPSTPLTVLTMSTWSTASDIKLTNTASLHFRLLYNNTI